MKSMIDRFDGDKVFFTSDTHFGHAGIITFCHRPFQDVAQMNETMIANWNRVVGPEDIVFHLGDFCLGGATEWNRILDRLNGRIYLVLGNHDHRNLRQSVAGRFEAVSHQMLIDVEGQKIYMNHYPFLCYNGTFDSSWQLFGHVHTCEDNVGQDAPRLCMLFPTQYDVGVDNNGFTPVSFAQVQEIIRTCISKQNPFSDKIW